MFNLTTWFDEHDLTLPKGREPVNADKIDALLEFFEKHDYKKHSIKFPDTYKPTLNDLDNYEKGIIAAFMNANGGATETEAIKYLKRNKWYIDKAVEDYRINVMSAGMKNPIVSGKISKKYKSKKSKKKQKKTKKRKLHKGRIPHKKSRNKRR